MLPLTTGSDAIVALNYLLHRHQVSLVRAQSAATVESRIVHRKLAALYADRIRGMSDLLGGGAIIAATAL
jgi:chromosome condensin MukBEF ATPase and DNA-binding subunit MukB